MRFTIAQLEAFFWTARLGSLSKADTTYTVSADPPRWAGALGMLLGSTLGIAACYVLATLL